MSADGHLHGKFTVTRTDGTDAPGGKHDGCRYFVLDVTHDPYAAAALLAYARACHETHPTLARDLHSLRVSSAVEREAKTGHDEDGCEAKQIRTNLAKVCGPYCRNYQETKP